MFHGLSKKMSQLLFKSSGGVDGRGARIKRESPVKEMYDKLSSSSC